VRPGPCIRIASVLASALLAGCGASSPGPERLDPANDQCAACRMVISEPRFAAQVAAPGEGLRSAPLPRGAVVFVADVRTGAWVEASHAVFARHPAMATPMASHWVAYADEVSRRSDPEGAAESLPASAVLGAGGGEK
jgi:copper chaperone NosL